VQLRTQARRRDHFDHIGSSKLGRSRTATCALGGKRRLCRAKSLPRRIPFRRGLLGNQQRLSLGHLLVSQLGLQAPDGVLRFGQSALCSLLGHDLRSNCLPSSFDLVVWR
jgi:hypothetical protein